ncbi:hypothetical protein [Chitinimonas lacunae]|uniref:Bacteriocin n=1 Tax=Chitinimonas lacunae TaxID=1963018 RepID=A0ABV8MME9_9NEIS
MTQADLTTNSPRELTAEQLDNVAGGLCSANKVVTGQPVVPPPVPKKAHCGIEDLAPGPVPGT